MNQPQQVFTRPTHFDWVLLGSSARAIHYSVCALPATHPVEPQEVHKIPQNQPIST